MAMSFVSDIYNSLNTDKGGFSSRKLSALAGIVTAIIITHKYTTAENLDSLVITWLLFVLLCLGLVTFGQIIQFRGGSTSSSTTTIKNETKTSDPN